MNKSLLTHLGEAFDAYRAQRREQQEQAARSQHLLGWRQRRLGSGNMRFAVLLMGLLLVAQSVGALPSERPQGIAPSAPSTNTIAYQGRLTDAEGAPLTGAQPMVFRLYNAANGGAPLWEEQWTGSSSVQVSDGLFNVMLGSLTPIPRWVITANSSLFLGITVGASDEMTPRVQMGSVPFAVMALTVPDGSVTTAKIADGAVTKAKFGADVSLVPPDGSITAAKIVDGAVTAPKLNLQEEFTVRQGQSDYKSIYGPRQIDMQDGPAFTGLTHIHTYLNHLWLWTDSGNVYVGGPNGEREDLIVNGAKSAMVSTSSYGSRRLYAVEAPDVRFNDEGRARLQNGLARVSLDPIFLETIEGEYLVHVTPYGDARLYVAEIGQDYFIVRSHQSDPDVAFAWRLSATRKGYAGVRLEEAR